MLKKNKSRWCQGQSLSLPLSHRRTMQLNELSVTLVNIRVYHDVPPVDVSKVTKQLFFITSLANRCVLYKRINGAIWKMLWKYTDRKSTVRSDTKSRTKYSKLIWTISGLEFSDKVDKSTDGLRMIPNHGKCQRSQKKNLITAFYIPK